MWTGAEAYDQLMGRWSQQLSPAFIDLAGVGAGDRVLDVGCGTGSLTRALIEHRPRLKVVGVDPAGPYVEYGRRKLSGAQARLDQADAQNLPFADDSFDRCLSLLVVNFIPDARQATEEMHRVTRPGGVVAAAVWDYGEGMEMLRIMWDAAVAIDPAAEPKHERNMPYCRKGELGALWAASGFQEIMEDSLIATLEFRSFDDYWAPFLTGVGPSGSYVSSLPAERQGALRDQLANRLVSGRADQPFTLQARAWTVRGVVPMQ